MSKKPRAMPGPMDRGILKDRIVERVSKAVKQIQEVHFCASGTSTDLTFTNQDWQFCKLVEHFDHAFLHGLRHITKGYWVVVQEFTNKATVKEIKRLPNVITNLGRGRAWLYLALMDHLLESYLRCFSNNIKLVKKYYAKDALVLDQQRMEILLTLASGLEYMSFQLEVDVPYLDLCSHIRPRTSSIQREMSDDQLSLCSMDSSMSHSSSMNMEGHNALGDLMEISSNSSSFEDNVSSTEGATSSYADAAPKYLGEDSLQEETRKRTERLTQISATVPTPDPMNPDDMEVVFVRAKLHRSKKRRSQKKKAEGDLERTSVNSLTLNSPLTPDSCYRSGEESISLDEAQEVFVSEATSGAANAEVRNGCPSNCDKTKCDSEQTAQSNENCADVCARVCDQVDSSTKLCDKKTEDTVGTKVDNETSDGCAPDEDVELNISVSIYDSPVHQVLNDSTTSECNKLHDDPMDRTSLASGQSQDLTSVLVREEERTCDAQNGNTSSSDTPSSSLNNDSGCGDLEETKEEEAQRNESSPEVDDRTLVSDLELVSDLDNLELVHKVASDSDTDKEIAESVGEHAANDGKLKAQIAPVAEDITSHNSPVRSLQDNGTLHHPAQIEVDNNLLLLIMLSIFKVDGEKFIKLFRVTVGHMEGEVEKVALLITTHAVYILEPAPGDIKYTVHSTIQFRHIDYLSLGLNYQSIQIVCTNRRNQYWITTGDWLLTRCIVGHLDIAMRESVLNLSNLTVLTDATNQKIALKKWVATECKIQATEVRVLSYVLGHWEDRQTDGVTIGASREGMLMCKDQPYFKRFAAAKWKPGFFVLKNGAFYQYEDSSRSSPPLTCIKLNGEECTGCRRSPQGERPYSFELVLSSGTTLQMAASSTGEQQQWLQTLCQAVSEGMGHIPVAEVPVPGGCLPSCIVVTSSNLLLCQEDTQTHFFRTLASASITDITGLSVDPVPHNYRLITFEGNGADAENWTFYFNAEDEAETFSQGIYAAWKEHFQVDLPKTEITDLSVLQHCREVLAKLSS